MWRTWNIGDRVLYHFCDFDGSGAFIGIVAEKHKDHLIIRVDDMNLWLDDDTVDMFRRINK